MEETANREKRKSYITKTAWKLFLDRGFRETTMADIAKTAGLSRKTLYQYFKSKEEIAFEIEICVFEEFIDLMEKEFPQIKGSGYERLLQYFNLIDSNLDKYSDAIRFTGIFDFQFKGKHTNTLPVKKFYRLVELSGEYLKSIIEFGINDGTVKEAIDPGLAADTINDSWLYLAQNVYTRRDGMDKVRAVQSRSEISYQMKLFIEALKK